MGEDKGKMVSDRVLTVEYYLENPYKYTKEEEEELIEVVRKFLWEWDNKTHHPDFQEIINDDGSKTIVDWKESNDKWRAMAKRFAKVLIEYKPPL